MVKTYLRYTARSTFGVIASAVGGAVFDSSGRLAVTAALDSVIVWDIKKGTEVARWRDSDNVSEVTSIARSPDGATYAVGYADGAVRLFSEKGRMGAVLSGHRGRVTTLVFDKTGTILGSGARDTDIVVWDVVGEEGLYRLRGHTDEITGLAFVGGAARTAGAAGLVISSSKDTLVKVWEQSSRACVQTLVAHRSEVWGLALSPDAQRLVTATAEAQLNVWTVDATRTDALAWHGAVQRTSASRVAGLQFHASGQFLAVLGTDRVAEVFRTRTPAEIAKRRARRERRRRAKAGPEEGEPGSDPADGGSDPEAAADELKSFQVVRTTAKAISLDLDPADAGAAALARRGRLRVLVAQNDNALHVWAVPVDSAAPSPEHELGVELAGHRGEPRALALSSDGELVASAAGKSLRIWNARTGACVRTLDCGTALCAAFLPGDQAVVVGTRDGALELYDIAAAALTERVAAHDGECHAIDVRADGRGLASGGADHCVKFWAFELTRGEGLTRRLTLEHERTLQLADTVLAVRLSRDARLLAVALLDSTVKVFYADSLKFFLSLYGHRLPVAALDISSDSTLLVTGSADKSVKLWGLDFGDCHRSLRAHTEPVTDVRFVGGTHYFFSAGKDRAVHQWDGDSFQRIQSLDASHGDVWALAVAPHGAFVVSASQDRAIRVWDRSDEPLFPEEERERELEAMYDRGIEEAAPTDGPDRPGRATADTLKAGERILEALDLANAERRKWAEYHERTRAAPQLAIPQPEPNPILRFERLGPEAYVLRAVERVRIADLDDALLVLPFARVLALLEYVDTWAARGWNTPLACRVLFFLLRAHQAQIAVTRAMRPRLASIRRHLRSAVAAQRDQIGYNLAALGALKADWEASATHDFFDEAAIQRALAAQVKKRKFVGLK
ncbi:beta transducin [Coemansia sp. RSA 552]|nr:beta transducin [Coemansia sp. RSA 552]